MSTTTPFSTALQEAIEHPTRGVVGLVDDLLRLCSDGGLELDWELEQCRVRSVANDSEETFQSPMTRSVFRAIVARVAALCNEQSANAVSPYQGEGELIVNADAPVTVKAKWTNSTDVQKLILIPQPTCVGSTSCRWDELQEFIKGLERACREELRDAVKVLKLQPSFFRIFTKLAVRAILDPKVWNLARRLFTIHPTKRICIAAVYGDLDELLRILQRAEEGDDELCLRQIELYAEQIVGCYDREIQESREAAEHEGASDAESPADDDDVW